MVLLESQFPPPLKFLQDRYEGLLTDREEQLKILILEQESILIDLRKALEHTETCSKAYFDLINPPLPPITNNVVITEEEMADLLIPIAEFEQIEEEPMIEDHESIGDMERYFVPSGELQFILSGGVLVDGRLEREMDEQAASIQTWFHLRVARNRGWWGSLCLDESLVNFMVESLQHGRWIGKCDGHYRRLHKTRGFKL